MNNSTFLEIDESMIGRDLVLSKYESKDDNLMKDLDSKPFFIIQPVPGICVKTKIDNGEKVFLNICTSDKILPPDDISDAKLFEILEEKNPQFVVPMSIGNERLETDKGGSNCLVYDIAINTKYFEKCQKNNIFLLFTISVIMDGVSHKFNKTLNPDDYIILKNRKVMGKLQQHRIENRKPRAQPPQAQKTLIEEIKSTTIDTYEKKDETNRTKNISLEAVTESKLNYVLLRKPTEGVPTNLIGLFDMPKGITSEDVEVLLNEDRIVITVEKSNFTHDLMVPYSINVASVKCFLDRDFRILRLDMPVESVLDDIRTS